MDKALCYRLKVFSFRRYSLAMGSTAVSIQNITKNYTKIGTDKFSVLSNVSFTVNEGECVGIVGPNGSGKTTLLRILSGITKPSAGKVELKGTVGSMLDVGSGFHPDLTGRENIALVGKLYGYSAQQINAYEGKIIENSGIGTYYDMPLKTYSQGMYLRLAFSMLMSFDIDVYLIDEILSVGDKDFQQKCAQWMQELLKQGKTLIIVSHNPGEIIQHCTRTILLKQGELIFDGEPAEAIEEYYIHNTPNNGTVATEKIDGVTIQSAPTIEKREVRLGLYLNKVWADGNSDVLNRTQPITIHLEVQKEETDIGAYEMFIEVVDLYGTILLTDGVMHSGENDITNAKGKFLHTCTFPANMFSEGYYIIHAAFRTAEGGLYKLMQVYRFHVVGTDAEQHLPYSKIRRGLRLPMQWQINKL